MFISNSIGLTQFPISGDYDLSVNEDLTVGADSIIPVFSTYQRIGNAITVTSRFTFVPTQIDPTIAFQADFNLGAFVDQDQASGAANISLVTVPTGMDGSVKISSSSSDSSIIFNFITPDFDSIKVYEVQAVYSYTAAPFSLLSFITEWDTTIEGDATVGLPLVEDGTYNFVVNWGDGNLDTITAYDDAANTHVYDENGVYTVTITGTCIGWNFYDSPYGYTQSITDILQWGNVEIDEGNHTGRYFSDTTGLTQISASDTPDLSNATTFYNLFANSGIVNINNLNLWDTSTITDMTLCFDQASSFVGIGIEGWNVQNVVFMPGMFKGCTAFNGNVNLWVTSSLQDMAFMFAQASTFNQSVAGLDVSNVTTLEGTFQQAVSFEGTGIENWVTSSVSTLKNTFDGITDATPMVFNGIVSDWDVSSVTDMTQAFAYCQSFDQPLNWTTTSCTTMFQMFTGCSIFNQDMPDFVTSSTSVIINMLAGCTEFNGDVSTWDVSSCTYFAQLFTNASSFNQPLNSWDVSGATNIFEAFKGCASFNQDLSNWVMDVTSYVGVFDGCTALDQDFSAWGIANVTDATDMFNGVTLSNAHYNALLSAWAGTSHQSSVTFSGGNSMYDGTGATARAALVSDLWVITDGGES